MNHRILTRFALLAIALVALSSWGTWGHYHINKAAVLSLPDSMRTFFYNHVDFVVEESVVPDIRRSPIGDKAEAGRHYFDFEAFELPIDSLKNLSEAAQTGRDEKFLAQNGILPWYIQAVMERLTKAMRERRRTEILFYAADLGHYLADAHMPLHTSLNHDGQLTNQKGIHAFWESRLPDMFGEAYNLHTDSPHYIADLNAETWDLIAHTHSLVEPLLSTERRLRDTFPKENVYQKDKLGNVVKNRYQQAMFSDAYAAQFHQNLNGMVESQMRKAISTISSYWYTAWVNAGRPDLTALDDTRLTERNQAWLQQELAAWKEGKIILLKTFSE